MRLIVASSNKGKVREIKEILSGLDLDIVSKDEAGFVDIDPVEDGDSLLDNAKIKARSYPSEDMVLADDTGLFVRALAGPGVHTARYAGEGCSDEDNRKKMLKELEGVEDRSAYFETVMVLSYKDKLYQARGRCKGRIAEEEKGQHGFGYDPIFIPQGYSETFAQLDEKEKNKISHRRRALEAMREVLEDILV